MPRSSTRSRRGRIRFVRAASFATRSRGHHPEKPVHEPRRLVQEPGVRALRADGAGAEPELPLAGAAAGEQLLPGGRTRPAPQHAGQLPPRLESLGELRFFLRFNGNTFEESSLVDWTYDSPEPEFRGLHDVARARFSWSATGSWTKVLSNTTVIDTQISGNRAHQRDTRKNLVNYQPTSVGLPAYWTISVWRASSASCPR